MPMEQLMLLPAQDPPRLPTLPPQDALEVVTFLADLLLRLVTDEADEPATKEVEHEVLR